tara:strand:+ start:324 stop:551 length:228 start_codon:yes stop_codon:yes gene_type:complete
VSEETLEFEHNIDHDAVVHVATEIHGLLSTEALGNYNGIDILVALESIAAWIREQYGIVELEEIAEQEDENDSEV